MWFDSRLMARGESHGDGRGEGCNGDGQCLGNYTSKSCGRASVGYVESLKKGERFKKIRTAPSPNAHEYEALEDAYLHRGHTELCG